MAHKTLLERAEEAEHRLAIAEALAGSRANALILSDRRVAELEAANKALVAKLDGSKTKPAPDKDAFDRKFDIALECIHAKYGSRLDLFFADAERLRIGGQ